MGFNSSNKFGFGNGASSGGGGGLSSVATCNTNTFSFYGDGTIAFPLCGCPQLSSFANQGTIVLDDGLWSPNPIRNGLVYGGVVTWLQNYDYSVSAAGYYINGVFYTSPQTTVTLAPSDPTLDRIDLFVVTTSGTATSITGTPANPPQAPTIDPNTELDVSFALVTAGSTAPSVTSQYIYLNNAEWTTSVSSPTINPASTNNPFSAPLDVEFTNTPLNANITFTTAPFQILPTYQNLILYIRSKVTFPTNRRLLLTFRNGATTVGAGVIITGNSTTYGFDSAITSVYQRISIPLANFGLNNGNIINNFRIQVAGTVGTGNLNLYVDNIEIQSGTPPPDPQLNIYVPSLGFCSTIRCNVNNSATSQFSSALAGRCNVVNTGSCYSSVLSGLSNTINTSNNAVILGGRTNTSTNSAYSFIGGGRGNGATNSISSAVVGGCSNSAFGSFNFIGGGCGNQTYSSGSIVIGGVQNAVAGGCSGVFGGYGNTVVRDYSYSIGGQLNLVDAPYSIILGGNGNLMTVFDNTQCYNTILNGFANTVMDSCYSVMNGRSNSVSGSCNSFIQIGNNNNVNNSNFSGTISGSYNNINSSDYAIINNGCNNSINTVNRSYIGNGDGNSLFTDEYGVIGNGNNNSGNNNCYGYIGNGSNNLTQYQCYSTILNGSNNSSSYSNYSSILNGSCNTISNYSPFSQILGGCNNIASGIYSSIANGCSNFVQSNNSSIVNGNSNVIFGNCSFIGSGSYNCTLANYNFTGSGAYNRTCANLSNIIGGDGNVANSCRGGTIGGGTMNYLGGSTTISSYSSCNNCIIIGGDVTGQFNINDEIYGYNNTDNTFHFGCVTGSTYSAYYTTVCTTTNFGTTSTIVVRNLTTSTQCGCNSFIGGGSYNQARGINSVTSGGQSNTTSGNRSFTGSGYCNTTSGSYAFNGSGFRNSTTGFYSTTISGNTNTSSGTYSSVINGSFNTSSGISSFVASGFQNTSSGTNSTILNGAINTITSSIYSQYNTIINGNFNSIISNRAETNTVQGRGNTISGYQSCVNFITGLNNTVCSSGTVAGLGTLWNQVFGDGNIINLTRNAQGNTLFGQGHRLEGCNRGYNFIIGRTNCIIDGGGFCDNSANIIGGINNRISGTFGVHVLFGTGNVICATSCDNYLYAAILSGASNRIENPRSSAIVTGQSNCIIFGAAAGLSGRSFIGGGCLNVITCSSTSSITSGRQNVINGTFLNNISITSGCLNTATANNTFIGGGVSNTVSNCVGAILSGCGNIANAIYSTVINGCVNTASGQYAAVINGDCNLAQASFGFIGNGVCNNVCNSTSGCLSLGSVVVGGVGNNTTGGTWDLATCTFTVAPTICNAGQYSFIGGGFQNVATGNRSSVLGGQLNNTCGFADAHIVGSCLNATQACTTFVNCLSAANLTCGNLVCVGANSVIVNTNFGFGAFSDTTLQTMANTACEQVITFNCAEITNGVSLVNTQCLQVSETGTYGIDFSLQLLHTSGGDAKASVWVKCNCADIARSASYITVNGNNSEQLAAVRVLVNMNANDYLQLYWNATDTDVSLSCVAAGASPTRPVSPSIIANLQRIR